jgi:N-terminal domain of anti-restriction factor ArdC
LGERATRRKKPRKARQAKRPAAYAEAGAEKGTIPMDTTLLLNGLSKNWKQGCIPRYKPWRSIGTPCNLGSKKLYRGINVWLLTMQGYTSPYWATIRQINELGGSVRRGEKATPVVLWRIYLDGAEVKTGGPEAEAEEAEGQGRRRFVLRYYSVFQHGAMRAAGIGYREAPIAPRTAADRSDRSVRADSCRNAEPARNRPCRRQGFLFADHRSGHDADGSQGMKLAFQDAGVSSECAMTSSGRSLCYGDKL